MFRSIVFCVALATFTVTPRAHADEGLFLSLGLGESSIEYDEQLFAAEDEVVFDESSEVIGGEVLLGYEFRNDLFLEAGLQGFGTIGIFGDDIDLSTARIGAGYSWPSSTNLRVVTKAGLTFWDLEARESFLFNPGPEAVSNLDGTDWFGEAGVEYRFVDSVRLALSAEYVNFDFGSGTTLKVTLKFVP